MIDVIEKRSEEVQKSRRQSNRTFRGSVICAWCWTAYEPNIRIHYFNNTVLPIAADTMPRAMESTLYRETLL
ncbi:NADH-ubiquinone oxidoreductase chain [Trichinella spiralis]|uniref:NADH-ubiquinone oxidoreductase chain n=1 Tax=Trichinella spiralis TaxID=6334 RepID=A0ABR3KRJ0_TRISP